MFVDFTSLTVLPQEATKHTLPAHPEDLGRHSCLGGTFSFTGTSVATLGLGSVHLSSARARVDSNRTFDNETIFVELADSLTGVGVSDLSKLGGVELDLTSTEEVSGGDWRQTQIRQQVLYRCLGSQSSGAVRS